MKRERAARDGCQQVIMQQIMIFVLFMSKSLAGRTSSVQHFHQFAQRIQVTGGRGDMPNHMAQIVS
jgi:hypothetical protein